MEMIVQAEKVQGRIVSNECELAEGADGNGEDRKMQVVGLRVVVRKTTVIATCGRGNRWGATGPDGRGGGKRSVGLRESEEGIGGVLTGRGGAEAENVHRRRKEGVRWPVILREEGIKGVSFDNEVGGLASEAGEGRKRRGAHEVTNDASHCDDDLVLIVEEKVEELLLRK
ncbi:hypothetical protein BHE74_00001701 [Ensete ventricosum]|nr:hypothetical protein BHE74_00001701 [Ensete ventricosum]